MQSFPIGPITLTPEKGVSSDSSLTCPDMSNIFVHPNSHLDTWILCFFPCASHLPEITKKKKKRGGNAHTPLKLSTTSRKTPSTFLLANLLLKLFKTAKSIL